MLRIRYKDRSTVFEYHCKRNEVKEQIASHLLHWGREGEDRKPVPVSDVIAEWVDGETVEPIAVG